MIAADTSAWVDFAKGVESSQSKRLEMCLVEGTLVMPTPVVFEVLSGPGLIKEAAQLISRLPALEILPAYWQRAADLRRTILKKGLKARSMDCLVAQNCIDHDIALIASDQDFRHFTKLGLKLI